MHAVFENVPADVRQKAYNLFQSLPRVGSDAECQHWRETAEALVFNTEVRASVCPLGAVAFVHGKRATDDLLPMLYNVAQITGYPLEENAAADFMGSFDKGEITDLAEAMGVTKSA